MSQLHTMNDHEWERVENTPSGRPVGNVCRNCGCEVGPMLYFVRVEPCPSTKGGGEK